MKRFLLRGCREKALKHLTKNHPQPIINTNLNHILDINVSENIKFVENGKTIAKLKVNSYNHYTVIDIDEYDKIFNTEIAKRIFGLYMLSCLFILYKLYDDSKKVDYSWVTYYGHP